MARILVADDMEDILKLVRRVLEAAGHTVVTAMNGHEALKLGLSQDFDLYIFDVKMPQLDGYSLSLSITKRFPGRKVVIVTGLDSEKYAVMLKACGASGTISKPFDGPEFMKQIGKFIQ
jgi:DNA-binding response OmpR family regulator